MESAMVVDGQDGDLGISAFPDQISTFSPADEDQSQETQRIHLLAPPVDSELLEQLRQADSRISANWGGFNKMSMAIGWDGYFIKKHDGWRALGYENEKHFRKLKGIGRSTWYRLTGIAERLSHLTMEQFLAMTIDNAEQLSVQPAAVKRDPDLIEKAQTRTAEEFSDELVLDQAAREGKPVGEVYVTLKWRLKQAQREVIEHGLEDWQHEHGLDNPAYALELMIAEVSERATLAGFLLESIPALTREIAKAEVAEDVGELRKLLVEHIRDMAEILRVVCGEDRVPEFVESSF
jgi:hypothetical protein